MIVGYSSDGGAVLRGDGPSDATGNPVSPRSSLHLRDREHLLAHVRHVVWIPTGNASLPQGVPQRSLPDAYLLHLKDAFHGEDVTQSAANGF